MGFGCFRRSGHPCIRLRVVVRLVWRSIRTCCPCFIHRTGFVGIQRLMHITGLVGFVGLQRRTGRTSFVGIQRWTRRACRCVTDGRGILAIARASERPQPGQRAQPCAMLADRAIGGNEHEDLPVVGEASASGRHTLVMHAEFRRQGGLRRRFLRGGSPVAWGFTALRVRVDCAVGRDGTLVYPRKFRG